MDETGTATTATPSDGIGVPPGRIAPLLVSIGQAAEALGISRANLYEIVGRNEIRTVKIGRRRLVAVRDLEHFVDELPRGLTA